jgi:hypothetical protein
MSPAEIESHSVEMHARPFSHATFFTFRLTPLGRSTQDCSNGEARCGLASPKKKGVPH